MGLFFNQGRNKEVFQNNNDNIKDSNQIVYRENFLESVINEQQQLNKQFAENATKHAEKHEKYSQALLDQLTIQDSLLLEMHRKLQSYEKTTISIQEQLQVQDEIKELLERHDDLQNIFHQTTMERFDNQYSNFTERMNKHDTHVMDEVQKEKNQIMEQLNKQETLVIEHINRNHTQLNTDLYINHTQLLSQLNQRELQASEQFALYVAKLNDYFNHHNHQFNDQANKLDILMEQFNHHDNQQTSGFKELNNTIEENFQLHDAALKEQIAQKDNQLIDYVSKLDTSLMEQFNEQNQHLKELVDHQDVQNEQLERKLDFIKSTIFERAADLSEKLDGHFKKFTEFFGSLFSRSESNQVISLPEEKENDKEEKIKTQ
ncbi:hypothetical protein [Mesobacillus maritimus]|uniref:hypothetical protein n=1 Tax=Mesobacillus maritimus TaxID=1643336 RepID=UPI00384DD67F